MAEIQPGPLDGKSKRKIRPTPFIDMTPLVDLGFLLISFFIFTSSLTEQKALKLFMPKDEKPTPVKASQSLTVLLGANSQAFVYMGEWKEAVRQGGVIQTNYHVHFGLGNLIRRKQKELGIKKDKLVYLIKPLPGASYQNVVDALDEALINQIENYSLVDATPAETGYVRQLKN